MAESRYERLDYPSWQSRKNFAWNKEALNNLYKKNQEFKLLWLSQTKSTQQRVPSTSQGHLNFRFIKGKVGSE